VLEESADATTFAGGAAVYRGPATAADLYGRGEGTYAYRVRAEAGGATSDWSDGVVVAVGARGRWYRDTVPDDAARSSAAALLTVQRALLRMGAARGDLLAVLSLPAHHTALDAAAHAARLRGEAPDAHGPGGLDLRGEARALSHGALYHPWTVAATVDRAAPLRTIPPDGAIAGVLARRARTQGAWVAPANEPLADVVALAPAIPPAAWLTLQDARVNLVRQEPAGFLCLAADTLSADDDLRPIGVRRLLALLRRVALLQGPTFAFEPDDGGLRQRVQRAFEALLARLLELGAFAGATRDEAFQVVVDDASDQGRLVVDLRVAPSRPLAFLTVRLVHTLGRGLVVEGV
jgi:hypothetical protein